MCLIANVKATECLKQLEGKITVWKVFNVGIKRKYKNQHDPEGKVVATGLRGRYRSYNWLPKKHVATGACTTLDPSLRVNKGIHVCLSEEEAKFVMGPKTVVGKFEVPVADVLFVGSSDGVTYASNGGKPISDIYNHRFAKQATLKQLTMTKKQHTELLKAAVNL